MSAVTSAGGFSLKDLVFIGDPAPLDRKVIWRIASMYEAAENKIYAVLTSGMTERSSTVPLERLSHYRPRVLEPVV